MRPRVAWGSSLDTVAPPPARGSEPPELGSGRGRRDSGGPGRSPQRLVVVCSDGRVTQCGRGPAPFLCRRRASCFDTASHTAPLGLTLTARAAPPLPVCRVGSRGRRPPQRPRFLAAVGLGAPRGWGVLEPRPPRAPGEQLCARFPGPRRPRSRGQRLRRRGFPLAALEAQSQGVRPPPGASVLARPTLCVWVQVPLSEGTPMGTPQGTARPGSFMGSHRVSTRGPMRGPRGPGLQREGGGRFSPSGPRAEGAVTQPHARGHLCGR